MRYVFFTMILCAAAITPHAQGTCAYRVNKKPHISSRFSYPAAVGVVEIERPFVTKFLAGRVQASNGVALEKVLVELVTPDWKHRIKATFTDHNGCFRFDRISKHKGKRFL